MPPAGDESFIPSGFQFHPVTPGRIEDLRRFSESHGKFRYCSCMRWRLTSSAFQRSTKDERAAALEQLVLQDTPIGILAYQEGEPVGWCSIAPREAYAGLMRYKGLPRIDAAPAWLVTCFFIDRRFRRRGLTAALLRAAVTYAVSEGASAVEGYPVSPDASLYTYMGAPSAFQAAGFQDVTLAGATRRLMRYSVDAAIDEAAAMDIVPR